MTKITLASASPQRKKLLKVLNVPFTVRPSGVAEMSKIQTTVSALVKHNALIKAEDIASKVKTGIVIGSDTVVYLGGKKLILKPRSVKEAKRNLKLLFHRPQWVYSGVAVIDAATGKREVVYEKTRLHMTHLTDKEIDAYYKLVDPMGKAGGFDIEGWGSIFIRRIEGCYTNVIGLPMATLAGILKKFGVNILNVP